MCCEVQGHSRGQGQSRVPDHLHNDVTDTFQPGSRNDVINARFSTANSDAVANSNGL